MSELYEGREQSQVKHFILRKYLERFAIIIGLGRADSVTYVDCFSGPWNVRSTELKDSSFSIALAELRKAQNTCRARGHELMLRCFFLEENKSAYDELLAFAERVKEHATIATKQARLQEAVPGILDFIRASHTPTFPFILIDPTGWTGFELDVITPLLKLRPGEVLVNFMTSFIRRFIKSPDAATQRSFDRVFGCFKPQLAELQKLTSEDLDDALVDAYSRLLRETGGFSHICKAIVLHPDIDSTHFHLIYATRNPAGVEVFKEAEKAAMNLQQELRAGAKSRKRTEISGPELFAPEVMDDPAHAANLRVRYLEKSKGAVAELVNVKERVTFDEVWLLAMSYPIVQEADLKQWIMEWQTRGQIRLEGLKPRQRVPQRKGRVILTKVSQVQ
jgi:three-Cys-motif partner protein